MVEDGRLYELTAWLFPVVEVFLQGYCLGRFVKPFMERKEKAWYVWAAYFFMMLMLNVMGYHSNSTAVSIGIFVAFVVMCWVDQRNYEKKIFLCAAFYCLCWLACAISEILYDNLYSFATHTDFMAKYPDLWEILYAGMCLVYLISEFSIMLVGIWCVLKVYVYKSARMTKKELCMLLAPLFTGSVGLEIIHYYRSFYIRETGKNIKAYDIQAVIYYTVSIAVVVMVIGLYQSIKAKQIEKLQNELLATQIESIRHHIGQVESLYQNIRSIKHDMTNHIMTLEGLYVKNKMEEAREYSANLKAALAVAAGEIHSGNPITDVILQEWKNEAEKKGLHFHANFYYPTGSGINAFDISVILNNALQNAIENTTNDALVSIRSYHRNNAYMIEVTNRFAGNLQWDAESGLPLTSKGKTDGHGYGLSNIRRVAAKYAGDIAVDIKNGEFCLSVMLMMDIY